MWTTTRSLATALSASLAALTAMLPAVRADAPAPAPKYIYFDHPVILAHGVMMLLLFGIWFPGAAFLARYHRTDARYRKVHAGVQIIGAILVFVSFALIMTNSRHCSRIHRFFGYVILGLVGVQLLGGLAHLRSLAYRAAFLPKRIVRRNRRIHATCGVALLILGFVNMPQGIAHDYPLQEKPFAAMYLYYWAVLVLWIPLFTYGEVVLRRADARDAEYDLTGLRAPMLSITDSAYTLVNATGSAPPPLKVDPQVDRSAPEGMTPLGPPAPLGSPMARRLAYDVLNNPNTAHLPLLSWETFNGLVADQNRQLVVGVGSLVLDVTQWITAHPGGHQVLLDAIGTSIVVDMFIEEEYDKSLFKAFAGVPEDPPSPLRGGGAPSTPSTLATNPYSRPTTHTSSDASTGGGGAGDAGGKPSVLLAVNATIAERRITQAEWVHILASRRTNIHSRTAIAKLMTMAVARVPEAGHAFSKFEFRRYALSQKTLVSPPGVSGTAPVYHLTFCLLYPHEAYPEEPSFFLPGHVVEIRMRLPRAMARRNTSGSPYVTRYYTPISGNATHFTIAIKMRPGGLMSDLLTDLGVENHRQFQIRGPFGSPLLNPARALPLGNGSFDHVVFIGVGSGTTPGLQSAAFQFAQTYFPQVAAAAHSGSSANELRVSPRDRVLIKYPMHSGWVWATNTTTHCDGYLPLRTLVPWVGRATRFTMVAADATLDHVVGRATFDLLTAAYPDQVQVHYRVKSLAPAAASPFTTQGRVDREYVLGVLQQCGFLSMMHNHQARRRMSSHSSGASPPPLALRVVLCGPQQFLDEAYEWTTDVVPEDLLWVLPTSSYLTLHEHNALVSSSPRNPMCESRPTSFAAADAYCEIDVHPDVGEAKDEEELFLPGLAMRNDGHKGEWFYVPTHGTVYEPSGQLFGDAARTPRWA
ncbi:hypothetical protein H9P43_002090 [Blastocladiella emersonii ATCC 22665]|nr:hypothetical protein H9P43_002090 [Blastocladiella emersonii ATCC 22665]